MTITKMHAIPTPYKGYKFRSRTEARWAVFFDSLGVEWEYEKEGYHLDGVNYLPDFWLPKTGRWGCFVEIKPKEPNESEDLKARKLAYQSGKFVMAFCGNPWPGEFRVYQYSRKPKVSDFYQSILNQCIKENEAAMNYQALDAFWKLVKKPECSPGYDTYDFEMRMKDAIGEQYRKQITEDCRTTVRDAVIEFCDGHNAMSFGTYIFCERCDSCGQFIEEWYRSEKIAVPVCFGLDEDKNYDICESYWEYGRLLEAFTAARSARFEFGESG